MRAHRSAIADHRSAWVSLASEHGAQVADVAELLLEAVESLAHPPRRVDQRSPTRRDAAGPGLTELVTRRLEAIEGPWLIYVDHLHHANSEALAWLGDLFDRVAQVSSSGAIVAAGEELPPWPLSRWEHEGRATIIGPIELHLDDQVQAILLGGGRSGLASGPSGTRRPERGGATSSPTGRLPSAPDVLDVPGTAIETIGAALDGYIREELLDQLGPVDLSILGHLLIAGSASSTDLVTAGLAEEQEATERLRRMVHETALVVESDDGRFELNPLLSRALAARLQRLGTRDLRRAARTRQMPPSSPPIH